MRVHAQNLLGMHDSRMTTRAGGAVRCIFDHRVLQMDLTRPPLRNTHEVDRTRVLRGPCLIGAVAKPVHRDITRVAIDDDRLPRRKPRLADDSLVTIGREITTFLQCPGRAAEENIYKKTRRSRD